MYMIEDLWLTLYEKLNIFKTKIHGTYLDTNHKTFPQLGRRAAASGVSQFHSSVRFLAAAVTQPAPDFRGQAVVEGDFKEIALGDFRGKHLVLFFYPLDLWVLLHLCSFFHWKNYVTKPMRLQKTQTGWTKMIWSIAVWETSVSLGFMGGT